MKLRPYQQEAKDAILEEWESGRDKTLLVLPTGTGKTIVFSKVIEKRVMMGDQVLVLAHRGELLDQAQEKLEQSTGLKCSIEKAELSSLDSWYRVTVGSVQTLMRDKRLERFDPSHFGTIIVDEAHHAISDSYQKVLNYFDRAKVLGVTATPDRGDMRNLGSYFESLAYEYTLPRAIKEGYLTPIKALTIPLELDLTGVKQQAGDYSTRDLGSALDPYLEAIADEMAKVAMDRKTVVFLPLIATSKRFTEILNSKGFRACEVNGESEDRDEVIEDFAAGKYNVICNSMLLCLDMETEILTDKGFVKHSEITYKHKVANWDVDGSVYFEEPKEIIKRPLGIDEHMVKIESKTINFNVTHTHKMIVGAGEKNKSWKKISAEHLRNGHVLPTNGVAEPFDLTIEQPDYKPITKREINSRSYHIRQSTGMNIEDSKVEALKRAKDKRKNLYTQPKDLSIDDCKFIGFWIADGSKNKLQSGGIEYTAVQGTVYPHIIEWFRNVIKNINVDFIERKNENKIKKHFTEYITWSFPRGTGAGPQKRNGLFRLEPYLKKDGTDLFWALNEEQFDALIEGYWYGDDHHGQAESGMPDSIFMSDTNEKWINLLCTIGCVRGWRCRQTYIKSKNKKHKDQYGLRMIKNGKLNISNKTVIDKHSDNNEVWCVRTTTKNIITRRHGIVTVMGNTEGWDCPPVDCVVVLRPTRVRSLYSQMVGRGTRLYPGKDHLLLLDFLWHTERHELVHPAHLIAGSEEVAQKMTEKIEQDGGPVDLEEVMETAEQDVIADREAALAEQLKEMRKRKRQLVDPLQFEMSIQAEDLSSYVPAFGWEMGPPTDKQLKSLEKYGIFPDEVDSAGKAKLLLDRLDKRRESGLATPKQIRLLERYNFQHVGKWMFDDANKMISRIAASGWRTPRGVNPFEFTPGN